MAAVPKKVSDVVTPCLLVNLDIVKSNVQKMTERCKTIGVKMRPHMKTTKCLEIGDIATSQTKRCISVSTLREAEYFADGGFDDILCTSLFTADKIPRMKALTERLEQFHVMVDQLAAVKLLEASPLTSKKWSVSIMVDCGDNREGVLWDDDLGIDIAKKLGRSPHLQLKSLYTHDGNSYDVVGSEEIQSIGDETAERILDLANRIREAGVEVREVGTGSTPTASHPSDLLKDTTELHPGNFIFYDVMQANIASCPVTDIAIRVATRVIGHYPHRNQMLIDAGWTAMSLDGQGKVGPSSYCLFENAPLLKLTKMSQEVGVVEPIRGKLKYEKYPVGSVLLLLPYHACATAAMHESYYIHSGEDIVDVWRPCKGW